MPLPESESEGEARAGSEAIGAATAAASGAGAAIIATAAAACCATPTLAVLTVSLLGASGAAWAAGLKPYAPWFLLVSALAIAYGFRAIRRARRACAALPDRSPSATGQRVALVAIWLATALWILAVATNLLLRS
jgi:hypothetical protein